MKTEDLVRRLALSGAAVDYRAAQSRFWVPLALALVISIALVLGSVGPRPDWRIAAALQMFWMKLAFPAATGLAAAVLLRALGHPGTRTSSTVTVLALPVLFVWMMAGWQLLNAESGDRLQLVLGHSWLQCVLSIPALSVPAFILAWRAAGTLAPTRLAAAGAVAGLFAGAAAATAYAFYCDEMQAPFLAAWYVLGMLAPAVVGWVAGPRLLRW